MKVKKVKFLATAKPTWRANHSRDFNKILVPFQLRFCIDEQFLSAKPAFSEASKSWFKLLVAGYWSGEQTEER